MFHFVSPSIDFLVKPINLSRIAAVWLSGEHEDSLLSRRVQRQRRLKPRCPVVDDMSIFVLCQSCRSASVFDNYDECQRFLPSLDNKNNVNRKYANKDQTQEQARCPSNKEMHNNNDGAGEREKHVSLTG